MLQPNQRNDLIFALRKDFNPDTLESMLWNQLNQRLYDYLIPKGSSYPQVVEAVIDAAEARGWTWNLIEKSLVANPQGPHLNNFIAQHPALDPAKGPPPVVDCVMAVLLRGHRCFIDRKDLRKALNEMRSPEGGPRVLLVTGDHLSGKTYTRELISFISEKTPKNRAIYIDLGHEVFDARSLTEAIGQLIGMDTAKIPKKEDDQDPRWAKRLCGWIIERIVNPGDFTFWFVFDGFHEYELLAETKEWVTELAVQAETNVPQCRVVLLSYEDVVLPQIDEHVSREQIEPIGRDELLDFFEQLNRDHKQKYCCAELSSTVEVILAQVAEAIANKPESGAARLRLINKAVSQTARELFILEAS